MKTVNDKGYILKYLRSDGMWEYDYDCFSCHRHITCRKAERSYSADWFMDEGFKIVEVELKELVNETNKRTTSCPEVGL